MSYWNSFPEVERHGVKRDNIIPIIMVDGAS